MNNIHNLTGLGVKSEAMLNSIGIITVDAFFSRDVFELYQQLSNVIPSNLNMLYAMIGAQENTPWQEWHLHKARQVIASVFCEAIHSSMASTNTVDA